MSTTGRANTSDMAVMSNPADQDGDDGARKRLTVDVFFDVICPWCWIGTRHLRSALDELSRLRPDAGIEIRWCPYQLLPQIPLSGVPYETFYLNRLGSAEAVAARRAQVRRAGEAAGIVFGFERIRRMPNTGAALELVTYMAQHGTARQTALLVERLFQSYFSEGADIGDLDVLARLGTECGAGREHMLANLSGARVPGGAVQSAQAQSVAGGITGVPYYVFNGRMAVSGAQSPAALLSSMQRALDH